MPVPGQESANAAWYCQTGAAAMAGDGASAVEHAVELLGDPLRLQAMRAAARAQARPATQTIVDRIRDHLGGR